MYQYTIDANGVAQNASPRLYLLGDDENYEMLQLLGQELTFTVDLSTLPCGENGALYLGEMDKTGGRNQYNTGGANFGSGYCDAQCPVQTWKNGTLNTDNSGYCCNEMDSKLFLGLCLYIRALFSSLRFLFLIAISTNSSHVSWRRRRSQLLLSVGIFFGIQNVANFYSPLVLEANSRANSFTPHPCSDSDCDKSGCGLNPYAQGYTNYYGPGGTVDTSKPFTVITQFNTNDGTTTGTLTSITRKYIQNGNLVASANSAGDITTTESCNAASPSAAQFGGLTTMGKALGRGMVLTFAIWNDAGQFMNWLDSGNNGPCSASEGNPDLIIKNNPTTHVVFSNIRWGDIGSTFNSGSGGSTTTTTRASTTTTSSPQPTQTQWGQCGGIGWAGPQVCASPYKCTKQND